MTRMVDIDELMPHMMRYTPNLPEPTAYDFLRDASREWCQRTKCWRENTEFTIVSSDYDHVSSIPDADIFYIDEPQLGEMPLEPITLEELDNLEPGWQFTDKTEESVAKYITQYKPNTITVHPYQTGTVKARLVLQPSNDAESVPDFLVSLYGRQIGFGAASMALLMPDPEFSDAGRADVLNRKFERAIRRFSGITSRGQQRGRIRVQGAYF